MIGGISSSIFYTKLNLEFSYVRSLSLRLDTIIIMTYVLIILYMYDALIACSYLVKPHLVNSFKAIFPICSILARMTYLLSLELRII